MALNDFLPVVDPVDEVLPVDERWRRECMFRLERLRKSQVELAAHVGCRQSNVSQTLSPRDARKPQKGSKYAHRISMALGVELPLPARALVAAMRAERQNPDAVEAMIAAIERLPK